MKKYLKNGQKPSECIIDVKPNKDGNLSIKFADGAVHDDIADTEENLEKIEKVMESSAQTAIKNEPLYVMRSFIATCSVVSSITGAVAIRNIETLQGTSLGENLSGAAIIIGGGICTVWMLREWSRVREISKIKYRNKYQDTLSQVNEFTHSLDTSNDRIRELFESERPLSLINIDQYKKKDLKRIITEIERETTVQEEYGIQYSKKK